MQPLKPRPAPTAVAPRPVPRPAPAAPNGLSPFAAHVRRWTGCEECGLCAGRNKMCFARGTLPCDVFFLGEAPGMSEDVLGLPFVGPAGHLMDMIVKRSLPATVRVAFGNLVCCLPRDPTSGNKASQPIPDEIRICGERLAELISLAQPRLLVCVGALARDWADPRRKDHHPFLAALPHVDVLHPAAILRLPSVNQGLAVQKAVVTIATAWEVSQGPPAPATPTRPSSRKSVGPARPVVTPELPFPYTDDDIPF